tara:strand:- start:1660 stop:2103 length:444 start_codon:yes stop_codon:yes gene_type:complete
MRKPTRREVFLGLGALAVSSLAIPYDTSSRLRRWALRELHAEFGEAIAAHPDTAKFLDDFIKRFAARPGPEFRRARLYFALRPGSFVYAETLEQNVRRNLVRNFCTSTTAVMTKEAGVPFAYTGLFDPYLNPCANHLAAPFAQSTNT